MAKIEILAPFIFSWEGGFSDHPADSGGATNMGITLKTYEAYCKKRGYATPTVEQLKNLHKETAQEILRTTYWNTCRADEIESQAVANLLVDWVWHSGITGVKKIQQLLGVSVDGIVGEITLAAINRADSPKLFDALWNSRHDFFIDIVERSISQELFLKGWLRRLNGIEYTYLQLESGEKIYF